MKANLDWTYRVEDYPNDRSSERTLSIVAFGRRLTLAWSSPLRRHTGKDMGDAFLDDDDDDDLFRGDEMLAGSSSKYP